MLLATMQLNHDTATGCVESTALLQGCDLGGASLTAMTGNPKHITTTGDHIMIWVARVLTKKCTDCHSAPSPPWHISSQDVEDDRLSDVIGIVPSGNLVSTLQYTTTIKSLAPAGKSGPAGHNVTREGGGACIGTTCGMYTSYETRHSTR